MRSAKAATGKTGRTVSGKRSQGATGSDFPSQRDSKTFPRRLSVCVEFHGGHDGRIAKAERPSAASPNFSQLSARGCTAVGSRLYPIQKNRVVNAASVHAALGGARLEVRRELARSLVLDAAADSLSRLWEGDPEDL